MNIAVLEATVVAVTALLTFRYIKAAGSITVLLFIILVTFWESNMLAIPVPWVEVCLVLASKFSKSPPVTSKPKTILFFSENLRVAFKSFWIVSGMMYPYMFKVKVLFTILSPLSDKSAVVLKELTVALNLNLSGSPQYESEAYSIASTILFNWSL